MYPINTPYTIPSFNTVNPLWNNWLGGLPFNGVPGNTWNTPFSGGIPGFSPISNWTGYNTPSWFGNLLNSFGGSFPGATGANLGLPFNGVPTPWNWNNFAPQIPFNTPQVPFNHGQVPFNTSNFTGVPFNGLTGGVPFAGFPFNTYNPFVTPFNGWFGGFVPNFGVNTNTNGVENTQTNIPVGFGPFGLVYPCNGVVPQVKAA
jgi:hypothetical protein